MNFRTAFAIVTALAATSPAQADTRVLSSGLAVTYHDMINEAPIWRIRFVAPALSDGQVAFFDVAEDMEGLCQTEALPRLRREGHSPEQVVVTLMSAPVEFGVMTPEIQQFFESYRVQDGRCIWEAF